MHLSFNPAHWICLLAGLYLALTGLLLRDIVAERPPALALPASGKSDRRRLVAYGRRAVLVAIGLAAVAYGISRILI